MAILKALQEATILSSSSTIFSAVRLGTNAQWKTALPLTTWKTGLFHTAYFKIKEY